MDGNGLSKVLDESLALRLLEKVNDLNDGIFYKSILPVLLYAALPQPIVQTLSVFGLAFTALYLIRGKVPTEI